VCVFQGRGKPGGRRGAVEALDYLLVVVCALLRGDDYA
jgi:hypothetical protein